MTLRRLTFGFLFTYAVLACYGMVLAVLKSPQPFPLTPVTTLLAFCFSVLHAVQREGLRRAILLAVLVFLTGLVFESIGVATGLVYGPYHYSDQLGPKFLGLVPYLIPLAWTMMMYPSLVIADSLVSKKVCPGHPLGGGGGPGRGGDDRLGCGDGSHDGIGRQLGLGSQGRLFWGAAPKLLGLVADHVHRAGVVPGGCALILAGPPTRDLEPVGGVGLPGDRAEHGGGGPGAWAGRPRPGRVIRGLALDRDRVYSCR